MTTNDLGRFIEAQDRERAGFHDAMEELRTTGKRSHWIWFVFPQVSGLGLSPASMQYAIRDVDEAAAFLLDPVLGTRLAEITQVVAARLSAGVSLSNLMGSRIDATKLVSSLTLFVCIAEDLRTSPVRPTLDEWVHAAHSVLRAAQADGYPPCRFTLDWLIQADGLGKGPSRVLQKELT